MARRAGIHAAATATAPSSATVTICDSGSHGSIPKSRLRIDRAAVSADPHLWVYDKETGEMLAEIPLPANATGSPITLETRRR